MRGDELEELMEVRHGALVSLPLPFREDDEVAAVVDQLEDLAVVQVRE